MRALLEEDATLLVHRLGDGVWEVDITVVLGGCRALCFKVEHPARVHVGEDEVELLREDGELFTDGAV